MKNNNEIELTEDEEIAIVEKRIDHVHNFRDEAEIDRYLDRYDY